MFLLRSGRARCELALAQFRALVSEDDCSEVKAAAQAVINAGGTAAMLAEDLDAALPLFLGNTAPH